MPVDWYDSWKLNPPEEEVYTTCDECGREIYEGQEYIELEDGTELCDDSCFDDYAERVLNPIRKYAGEE